MLRISNATDYESGSCPTPSCGFVLPCITPDIWDSMRDDILVAVVGARC